MVNLQNSRINGFVDTRHILVADDWSEGYEDSDLALAFEIILKEWNQLTGGTSFDDVYYKQDLRIKDTLRLQSLDVCYRISGTYEYAKKIAEVVNNDELTQLTKEIGDIKDTILKDFRLDYLKDKKSIEQKAKQITQKIEGEDKEAKKKEDKTGKWSFDEMVIPIITHFKLEKIDENMTCSRYAAFINTIKKDKK